MEVRLVCPTEKIELKTTSSSPGNLSTKTGERKYSFIITEALEQSVMLSQTAPVWETAKADVAPCLTPGQESALGFSEAAASPRPRELSATLPHTLHHPVTWRWGHHS